MSIAGWIKSYLGRCAVKGCWAKADGVMIVHGDRALICDKCADKIESGCYSANQSYIIVRGVSK